MWQNLIENPHCMCKQEFVCVWVKVRDWVFVCMSKSENVLKDVCLNDDKIDCSSNTKEILIKRRQHFSQRIFLGKKKKENLVQLCLFFGVFFFCSFCIHRQTCIRSLFVCLFGFFYVFNFSPTLLDLLESTPFFNFFFFNFSPRGQRQHDACGLLPWTRNLS